MEYIRHLTESGDWVFSNVKSVGQLSELTTGNKEDLVGAINEINKYFSLNDNSLKDLVKAVDDINSLIEGLTETIEVEQGKVIEYEESVQEKVALILENIGTTETNLNEKIADSEGKIEDLTKKAEQIEADLSEGYEILDGKLVKVTNDLVDTNTELSSKMGRTEYDDNVGVNNWIASFYNVDGGFSTKYPKVDDFIGLQASSIEEVEDSVMLYPFNKAKTGIVHLFTNIRQDIEKTVTLSIQHTDGMSVLLNGGYVYYQAGTKTANVSISLRAGWNTVEILLGVDNKVGKISANSKLSDLVYKMTSKIGVGNKNDTRLTQAETLIKQTNNSITLKADKTVVESLGSQITDSVSQIEINAEAIESKVSKEDFNKYTGRLESAETKITQTATQIESLATKTELDTLNGVITDAQSLINQTASEVALKASKEELETVSGNISNLQSELSVQAGEISSKVASTTFNSEVAKKENAVTKSNTAPTTKSNGTLWLDTSKTPNILKRWNGSSWVNASPTTAGDVGAYSSTDGKALAGRISNAETSIAQTQTEIALKASQTDLDTITGRVGTVESSLTVQAEQIQSKVGQTDFTTVMESKENSVIKSNTAPTTKTTNMLWLDTSKTPNILKRWNGSSWVNASPTTAGDVGAYSSTDGKALAKRLTSAETSITQTQEAIDLRATKTEVETLVGDVRVGGRNLVLGSAESASSSAYFIKSYNLSEDWIVGQEYTISIWGNLEPQSSQRFGAWGNGSSTQLSVLKKDADGVHRATFKVASAPSVSGQNSGIKKLNIYNTPNTTATTSSITKIKVEKGNKATDWTPAPEDVDTSIGELGKRVSTAEASLTVQAEQIQSKVSQTEVTKTVNNAVNGIKIGGRNLVKNTKADNTNAWNGTNGTVTVDGYTAIKTSRAVTSSSRYFTTMKKENFDSLALEIGESYTLSGWFYIDSSLAENATNQSKQFLVRTKALTGTASRDLFIELLGIEKDKWIFASSTYVANEVNIVSQISSAITGTGTLYFRNIKLERGNKATDWTPAPEDVEDSIAEKADSSTVEAIEERIVTAETSITQTKGEIALRAKSTEVYTKSEANKNLTDAVDGIEVGGRNYFRPTLLKNLAMGVTILGENTSYTGFYIPVLEGETYTISRETVSSNRFRAVFTKTEPKNGVDFFGGTGHTEAYDNSLSITVEVPKNAKYLFLYLSNVGEKPSKIKLERGNKATDWTPAPEDVEDSIAEKADNKVVTELEKRISNAETSITQTSEDITLKANAKDVYTKTQTNTELAKKATPTDITNAVNSINIGGRNLILGSPNPLEEKAHSADYPNSKTIITPTYNNDITKLTVSGESGEKNIFWNGTFGVSSESRAVGNEFTVSLYVKVSKAINDVSIYWYDNGQGYIFTESFKTANTWVRVSHTYKKKANTPTGTFLFGFKSANWTTGGTLEFKNIMFEEGNKASSYSPAPEDVEEHVTALETRVVNAESSLTVQAEQIQSKVSQTEVTKTVNNAVDGIVIGGTNLVSGFDKWKKFSDGTVKENVVDYKILSISGNKGTQNRCFTVVKVEPNTQYTASIYVNSVSGAYFVGREKNNTTEDRAGEIKTFSPSGINGYKLNVGYNKSTFTTSSSTKSIVFELGSDATTATFSLNVERLKLEKGNKATDWNHSTEDIEERFVSAESSITQTANSIELKVNGIKEETIAYKDTTGTSNDWKSSKHIDKTGWYRIAQNGKSASSGNRAMAEFQINDTTSSKHATAIFNAGIMFGNSESLALTGFSLYSNNPFPKARIVKKSTYDQPYLELYVVAPANIEIYCRKNTQATGWDKVEFQAINEIPTGYKSIEYTLDKASVADVTSQNVAKDTANVGGVKSDVVIEKIETAEAEIKTTKDAVLLRATKTEVQTSINNIQVGGTNLMKKSGAEYLEKTAYATSVEVVDGKNALVFDNSANIAHLGSNDHVLEIGQEYTFSFFAKASESLNLNSVYMSSKNNGYIANTTISPVWTKYSFTFTPTVTEKVNTHLYPVIKKADGTYKKFYLTEWQLEKGNKASDWSPSPLDYSNAIETIKKETEATFEVQAGQIQGKVSQTEVNKALKDAKDYVDIIPYDRGKTFNNVLNYSSAQQSTKGAFVVKTNIPMSAYMTTLEMTGYNYSGSTSEIGLKMSFYAYQGSTFLQMSYTNSGNFQIKRVRLTTLNGKVVIILGEVTDTYRYPKIQIPRVSLGYNSPLNSVKDGWSAEITEDLSAFTDTITEVPNGRILEDVEGSQSKVDKFNEDVVEPAIARIETAESEIKATKDDILLRVTKEEFDVYDNKMLKTSPNLIERINIGNSATALDREDYLNSGLLRMTSTGLYTGINASVDLKPESEYVMRFKYKAISGDLKFIGGHTDQMLESKIFIDGVSLEQAYSSPAPVPIDNLEHEVVVRMKTNSKTGRRNIWIQPNRDKDSLGNVVVEIREWQIEEGLHPTPWSLNPKDVAERIKNTEATLKLTNESINSKVSMTEVNNAVSNINVGGRNLFKMSYLNKAVNELALSKDTNGFELNGWAYPIVSGSNFREMLKPSTQYTISYKYRVDEITADTVPHVQASHATLLIYSGVSGYGSVNLGGVEDNVNQTKNWVVGQILERKVTIITPANLHSTAGNYRLLGYSSRRVNSSGTLVRVDKGTFFDVEIVEGNKSVGWTPAPEDVYAYVDNVEIGGRNLIKDSKVPLFSPNNNSTSPMTVTELNDEVDSYRRYTPTIKSLSMYRWLHSSTVIDMLRKDELFTASFLVRAVGGASVADVYVRSSTNPYRTPVESYNLPSNQWTKVVYTFSMGKDVPMIGDGYLVNIFSSNGIPLDIKMLKIEKGNKATDWTPASEDLETSIKKVESSIDQKADTIALRVAKTEIGKLEITENLIPIRTGWELGTMSTTIGAVQAKQATTTRLRYFGTVDMSPSTEYSLTNENLRYSIAIHELDESLKLIKDSGWLSSGSQKYTTSSSTKFARFLVRSQASTSATISIGEILDTRFSLVKGSIYQAWKFSTKDLEERIRSTEAVLEVQEKAINSKVTTTDVNSLINTSKKIKDTRDRNEIPSWYFTNYPSQTVEEFKRVGVMGLPASFGDGSLYGVLTTIVRWNDKSGGRIKQVLMTDTGSYEREGNDLGTAWLTWKKMIDQATMGTYVSQTLGTWGVDVVRSGDVVASINASKEGVKIKGDKIEIEGSTTFTSINDIINVVEDVKEEVDNTGSQFGYKYYKRIVVNGSSTSTYYPVIIKGGDQTIKRNIIVKRALGETAPSDWNSATHKGALNLHIRANFGGWGGISYDWEIVSLEQMYGETFAGCQNVGHSTMFAIWLRGGGTNGAVYHIYSDQPLESNVHSGGTIPSSPQIAYNSDLIFQSGSTTSNAPAPRTSITDSVREDINSRKYSTRSREAYQKAMESLDILVDINSDLKVTPSEKIRLKTDYEILGASFNATISLAQAYGVNTTAISNAYNLLNNTSPKYVAEITGVEGTYTFASETLRNTFNNKVKAYWTAEEAVRKEVNDKINSKANSANTLAGTANATANTAQSDAEKAQKLANLTSAKLLYEDVKFQSGNNSVTIYNNTTGSTGVAIARIARPADCPTSSSHILEVTHTGNASPNYGGIYQNITSRAGAKFLIKYLIKLPTGRALQRASNSMGSGYKDEWLTSNEGTGTYTEYVRLVTCGTTGTFSTGGHLSVSGGTTPTTTAPLKWQLASIECYDLTDFEAVPISVKNTVDMADTWKMSGKTTINGGKIETDTITATQIKAGAITATKIHADAINGKTIIGANIRTSETANTKGGVVINSSGIFGYNQTGVQKVKIGITGVLEATDAILSGRITASEDSTFAGSISTGKDVVVGENIYMTYNHANRFDQKGIYFYYDDSTPSPTYESKILGTYLGIDIINKNMVTVRTPVFNVDTVSTRFSGGVNFNSTTNYALTVNNAKAKFAKGADFTGGTVNFTGATVTGFTPSFG